MKTCFRAAPRLMWCLLRANLLLLFFSSLSFATEINLESETLIRSFKRDIGTESDKQVLPVYEYLRLDADRLYTQNLSFHVYGWAEVDSVDSGYYADRTDGEFLYAYLEYANPYQNRSVRLGRQHVFAGVANDSIDGLRLSSDFGQQFSATIYGGSPVGLADSAGSSGDSIWGGRLVHHLGIFSNLGLSYKTINNDGDTISSKLGIDSAFLLPKNIGLYGNSVRNLETDGWAEHNYGIHLLLGDVSIRTYFEMFEYADYFDTGAVTVGPFISLADSDEQLETLGAELSWQQSPSWTFGVKAKQYRYKLNDAAQFMSLSATWSGNFSTQAGGEIGQMQGDAADSEYLLMRLFCYLDHLAGPVWIDFLSGDILYTLYAEEIYGQDYAYFASLGSGKMFFDDALQIKLSADYTKDPYFANDLRTMLTATFRFKTVL